MPARSLTLPGVKRIQKTTGVEWWWAASQLSRRAGDFRPRTACLWRGVDHPTPAEREAIEHQALRLYIEVQEWFAGRRDTPARRGTVYFVRVDDKVKIGFTQDVERRLSELQVASPVALELMLTLQASIVTERAFHKRFRAQRINREWFNLEGPLARFIERERSVRERQNHVSESPGSICQNHPPSKNGGIT